MGNVMKRVADDLARQVFFRRHARESPEKISGGEALNSLPDAPSCQKQETSSRQVHATCGPTRGMLHCRQALRCYWCVVNSCYGASGFTTMTATRANEGSDSGSVAPSWVDTALCPCVAGGDRPCRRCGDRNTLSHR